MNDHVLKRLPEGPRQAVETVLRCFSQTDNLTGLFVTGSLARGYDSPDDLDLVVVWDEPISDDKRRDLVNACRAQHTSDPDTDHFTLHGIVPEFHFMASKDQVRQMVENFCWHSELPPERDPDRAEGMLASLADSLPVYDPEGLAWHWQRMLIEEFPRHYQQRRVHEQFAAACRRLAHQYRAGGRRDLIYQVLMRLEFVQHLVKALICLNGRFFHGPKWTGRQLENLPLKPDNAWKRICSIFSGKTNAISVMRSLALDTGELIARTLPEADVDFSMNIVRQIT